MPEATLTAHILRCPRVMLSYAQVAAVIKRAPVGPRSVGYRDVAREAL